MMTSTSFQSPTSTDRQKYLGKGGGARTSVVLATSGLYFLKNKEKCISSGNKQERETVIIATDESMQHQAGIKGSWSAESR